MKSRVISLAMIVGLAAVTAVAIPMPTTGLRVWLKADALTGLTNGAPVDSWTDSSGNGNAATNTGLLRPTWQSNLVNGLPAIRFDGLTNYLQNTSYSHGTHDLTLFMVAKRNGNPAKGYHTLFIGGTDYLAPTSPNFYQLYAISNTTALTINFNTTGLDVVPGVGFTNSMFRILALSKDNAGAGSDAFHMDGVVYGSGTGTQTLSSKFYIGSWNNGNALNGDIAEIALYNTALSNADRELVEGLLAWKYGLQDNLPVSHTWKSSNPALVPIVPMITNAAASYVSSAGATLNGLLISTGGAPTTVSVYWGSADGGAPTSGVWEHSATFAEGQWGDGSTPRTNVTLPTPNITYYYRYAASNSAGLVWSSSVESFFAADSVIWIQAAAGTNYWTNSANWAPAVVPNSAGVIAVITNDRTGAQTIMVAGTNTVGELVLGHTNVISLAAGTGGAFRFDNGSKTPLIRCADGNHSMAVRVSYGNGSGLTVTNSSIFSITGVLGGFSNLVKTGSGTLQIYGNNTFTGDLIIKDGTVTDGNGTPAAGNIFPNQAWVQVENGAEFKIQKLNKAFKGLRGTGAAYVSNSGRIVIGTNTSDSLTFTTRVVPGGLVEPGFGETVGDLYLNFVSAGKCEIIGGDITLDLTGATTFDRVLFKYSANKILGGTLHLNFISPYVPTNGASWNMFVSASGATIADDNGGTVFDSIDSNVKASFDFTAAIIASNTVRITAVQRRLGATLMVH